MTLDRRRFLKWSAGAAGLALAGPTLLGGCRSASSPVPPPVFSASQRSVIAAACARILPSDDGPGAAEADCVTFIERTLAGRYYGHKASRFRQGADVLDGSALLHRRGSFAAIDAAGQDFILERVRSGKADAPEFRGSLFFDDLVLFTVEGFLGDPRHGGNRGRAGWEYIGYTPACAMMK